MAYERIRAHEMSEEKLRAIFCEVYCDRKKEILTFDGIVVKFHPQMFDHAFFESIDRKEKDKSNLSIDRCEKIYWIKQALEDAESKLKQGWIKKTKSYDNSRRVAVVKGNYVVIIQLVDEKSARFITAYSIDDDDNWQKLMDSPDWTKK